MNWFQKISDNNLYKKSNAEENYAGRVKVSLFESNLPDNFDVSLLGAKEIEVKYEILMEHRTWGINGIEIQLKNNIELDIVVNDFDTEREIISKKIIIEKDKLRLEKVDINSKIIALNELDVFFDKNLNIDYVSTVLTYFCL